jgi:ATP-dependent protease HslVU (ClpYQ) peptidase subunit
MYFFQAYLTGKIKKVPIEMEISRHNTKLLEKCQEYQKDFRNEEFFKSLNYRMIKHEKSFENFENIE